MSGWARLLHTMIVAILGWYSRWHPDLMSQILLLISSCFCFKSRQDLNLISPISRSDFYHKGYYLFVCAQITLCSPNRNKPNLCHMLSSQISCKVLVKLALRNFIHHGEAILRFLFLPNYTNDTQNIQFDLRDRDCKHPNSILRKDSDIYSETPIASDALESLMCNNHFHPAWGLFSLAENNVFVN